MRGTLLVLTLTLSPVAGWTAGVWHSSVTARSAQLSTEPRNPSLADSPDSTVPPAGSTHESEPTAGPEDDDVTPAVATYSHDDDGELYEEHSPQTEVARLREPVG